MYIILHFELTTLDAIYFSFERCRTLKSASMFDFSTSYYYSLHLTWHFLTLNWCWRHHHHQRHQHTHTHAHNYCTACCYFVHLQTCSNGKQASYSAWWKTVRCMREKKIDNSWKEIETLVTPNILARLCSVHCAVLTAIYAEQPRNGKINRNEEKEEKNLEANYGNHGIIAATDAPPIWPQHFPILITHGRVLHTLLQHHIRSSLIQCQ